MIRADLMIIIIIIIIKRKEKETNIGFCFGIFSFSLALDFDVPSSDGFSTDFSFLIFHKSSHKLILLDSPDSSFFDFGAVSSCLVNESDSFSI